MGTFDRILRPLAVAALALFLGAMLTEGFVLVPSWRSMEPTAFLEWYAANDRRLFGFFSPVTTVAGVLALASAVVAHFARAGGARLAAAAAALFVVIVLMFPAWFEGVNASFASGTIAAADVPSRLADWDSWHRVRTALAALALVVALAGLDRAREKR